MLLLAELTGSATYLHVRSGAEGTLIAEVSGVHSLPIGEHLQLFIRPAAALRLRQRDRGARRQPRTGARQWLRSASRDCVTAIRRRATTRSRASTSRGSTEAPTPCSDRAAAARRRCSTSSPASSSPTAGRVLFDGVDVTELSTAQRNIAQVFQFPVLYDSMTVEQNMQVPAAQPGGRQGRRPTARRGGRRVAGDQPPAQAAGQGPVRRCQATRLAVACPRPPGRHGDPLRRAADGDRSAAEVARCARCSSGCRPSSTTPSSTSPTTRPRRSRSPTRSW